MEITVNQETYLIDDICNLQQVIHFILRLSPNGIAIAVNQEIISRENWASYDLKSGDHLTIIKATQGG